MTGLSTVYMLHLHPQLAGGTENPDVMQLGLWLLLCMMCLLCLVRTVITDPGTIPDSFKVQDGAMPFHARETKQTGEIRVCKWCKRVKADRCHHCRACNACILKMDHHCRWINSCTGFYNYKFFFQLIVYAAALFIFMLCTMARSTLCSNQAAPPRLRIAMYLAELLLLVLSIALSLFLALHVMLIKRGLTSIEFCEKRLRSKTAEERARLVSYDLGPWQNFIMVFGDSPWGWFLPLGQPKGDGLSFPHPVKKESPVLLNPERRRPGTEDEKGEKSE